MQQLKGKNLTLAAHVYGCRRRFLECDRHLRARCLWAMRAPYRMQVMFGKPDLFPKQGLLAYLFGFKFKKEFL